jgi:eukaryotic-like serine/threonine-protein kinase
MGTMPQKSPHDFNEWPYEIERKIALICERFDAAWRSPQRPRIEEFLGDIERKYYAHLLRLLIQLEIDYRRRAGETPRREDYTQRFPDLDNAWFEEVLQAVEGNDMGHRVTVQPSPETQARGEEECPLRSLPRYSVKNVIGKGGFGLVYLAYDEQLQRHVAIKVPHRKLVAKPENAEAYLIEARIVARLDHPNIVPVYDVGSAVDCPFYIVSKFIEGSTLARKIREERPSIPAAATMIATLAETLQYTHRQALVHRDIKPSNILLDTAGKPYIADFGLALKEEDVGHGPRYAGTPAYMSPEQARGEGHRVDGRSDIFSLGIVFYEMLTGNRPFHADSKDELLERIASLEVRPPRQWLDLIPKEMERICMKALSKRASERYTTAQDMAADLRHFLNEHRSTENHEVRETAKREEHAPSIFSSPPGFSVAARDDHAAVSFPSDSRPLRIVPKGLRSFDAHDADFFLELLPGPRDRDGLPDILRFWKTRIEETDPEHTFTVGLIYGPSGCGKSSLVKAGLLPRLSADVLPIYVEAAADETETRLLNSLRKRFPGLPNRVGLRETLTALRHGQGITVGKKVLIVIDQFEQWLHTQASKEREHPEYADPELVQALRQCDGSRVQCVVMVRDDFWMAVTRFLLDLEVELVQGHNFAAADLFDFDHAKRVLTAFGRAFGKLPEKNADMSHEQKEFVKSAVSGLARENKIICVRLALFADMMKGRSWTPATLKEVGGAEGVGVTFLEETFSSQSANPKHRLHQNEARAVLKALLPASGTDIKGHMRSYEELFKAAGQTKDFDSLIRILDSETRLITPTDPEGKDEKEKTSDSSFIHPPSSSRYYQLTHDYLVHSLRDWLTRKQKETYQGRAELLLADRAAVWNSLPEKRQLPSLLQTLQIRVLTRKGTWTPPQRKFMRKATQYHLTRCALVLGIFALVGWGAWEINGTIQAQSTMEKLFSVKTPEVPFILKQVPPLSRWLKPMLQDEYNQAPKESGNDRIIRTRLALLQLGPGEVENLFQDMLTAKPKECMMVRAALDKHKQEIAEQLWSILNEPQANSQRRLRAAAGLAAFAPTDIRWQARGKDVADLLLSQDLFAVADWTEALQGAGKWLIPHLADFIEDDQRKAEQIGLIAKIYGNFATLTPAAYDDLEKRLEVDGLGKGNLVGVKKKVNIATALVVMGKPQKVWPLLQHNSDPTLRSLLIESLGPAGAELKVLRTGFNNEDVFIRRAILLSLGSKEGVAPTDISDFLPLLQKQYLEDSDPGIRAAAEWLLRQRGQEGWLRTADQRLSKTDSERKAERVLGGGGKDWYVNGQGLTMVILTASDFRIRAEFKDPRVLNRRFAIASKEVTAGQFLQFCREEKLLDIIKNRPIVTDTSIAAGGVTWYLAAAYCNWLSKKDGIPESEWCYQPMSLPALGVSAVGSMGSLFGQGRFLTGSALFPVRTTNGYQDGLKMHANYLQKTGYRLPTEMEWEYAARATATTKYAFGSTSKDLLEAYGWFAGNAKESMHRVGCLKPNDFGLFDMHGNAKEWTLSHLAPPKLRAGQRLGDDEDLDDVTIISDKTQWVTRGGSYKDSSPSLEFTSASRGGPSVSNKSDVFLGFRPARTMKN